MPIKFPVVPNEERARKIIREMRDYRRLISPKRRMTMNTNLFMPEPMKRDQVKWSNQLIDSASSLKKRQFSANQTSSRFLQKPEPPENVKLMIESCVSPA